ncbi:MAG: hypothetical protein AAB300_02130 [Nitrospirota bacterium]
MVKLHRFSFLLFLFFILFGLPQQYDAQAQVVETPLPLDPLTSQERLSARAIASANAEVKRLLGLGERKLIDVEFLSVKPNDEALMIEDAGQPILVPRYAVVVFYRYDGNLGVRATVDLKSKKVIEVTSMDGDLVPISMEEVAQASTLVLNHKELQQQLPPNKYKTEVVRVLASNQNDPCWKRRCLGILFRDMKTRSYWFNSPEVTVDLTGKTVSMGRKERSR